MIIYRTICSLFAFIYFNCNHNGAFLLNFKVWPTLADTKDKGKLFCGKNWTSPNFGIIINF